jgi:ankyrin repeat protein
MTALIKVSLNGHFEIVKLLIENNADVNIQDKVFFCRNYIKRIFYF